MKQYKAESLGEIWLSLIQDIIESGEVIKDRNGTLREQRFVSFYARQIEETDPIIKNYVPQKDINEMAKVFLDGQENAFGHDYWSIIKNGPFDQVKFVIDTLKSKPESKKAIITIGAQPGVDWVPCINCMHFYIREDVLQMHYYSRGQDIGVKFCPDLIAMARLRDSIVKELSSSLKVRPGSVYGVIGSAHVYECDVIRLRDILRNEKRVVSSDV